MSFGFLLSNTKIDELHNGQSRVLISVFWLLLLREQKYQLNESSAEQRQYQYTVTFRSKCLTFMYYIYIYTHILFL